MLTLDDFKKLSDLLYTARLYCNETDSPMEEAVRGLDHLQLDHLKLCEIDSVVTDEIEEFVESDDVVDTGVFFEVLQKRYAILQKLYKTRLEVTQAVVKQLRQDHQNETASLRTEIATLQEALATTPNVNALVP